MIFHNSTRLDTPALEAMLLRAAGAWPHDGIELFVRYSRKAAFSGTCCYHNKRIYINLGRDNHYPFRVPAAIARSQSNRRYWWREIYSVEAADAYQLVLFVFMHELYHWLVKKARRNTRQKEARCDRFAARALVEGFGAVVRDARGRPVPRSAWDIQDLDGFIVAALSPRKRRSLSRAQGSLVRDSDLARTPVVRDSTFGPPDPTQPVQPTAAASPPLTLGRQLLLFNI